MVILDSVKPLNKKEAKTLMGSDWWKRLLLTVKTVKVCGKGAF